MRSQNIINNPPDLLEVVQLGIAKLMVRKLRFPPPPNDIPIFCEALTEDLVRAGRANNHLRIVAALSYIGMTDKDFPTPARLIEVMALLSRQTSTYKELPMPDVSPSIREANLKKIKQMLSGVVDKANPNKPKHFNHDRHMASENGNMQLTAEQLIEVQSFTCGRS